MSQGGKGWALNGSTPIEAWRSSVESALCLQPPSSCGLITHLQRQVPLSDHGLPHVSSGDMKKEAKPSHPVLLFPSLNSSQRVDRYIHPRSRPLDKKTINLQWIPLLQEKHYIKSTFFPLLSHTSYMTAPIIKTWTTQGEIHQIPRGVYLLNVWDGCELNSTRLNNRKLHLNTFRNKTRQQWNMRHWLH